MTDNNIDKLSYSEAIKQLEEIVGKMQSPECDIDYLASYTSTALALMQHCKAKLHKTEADVEKALATLSATTQC